MRWPWQTKPGPVRPPKVGGTRAPDQVLRIDFSKPHDFHFGKQVFRGCVLVGFSTPVDEDSNPLARAGEWGHDRWLVLRQPDGRLAYVPREGLEYIEESQPQLPASPDAGEGSHAR
jgi:hypothetical protein